MRKYFKESHKAYDCQKEVEVISKHPMTEERFREQIRRNSEESIRHAKLPSASPKEPSPRTSTKRPLKRPENRSPTSSPPRMTRRSSGIFRRF